MKVYKVILIILTMNIYISCKPSSKDALSLKGSECKLWWLYDERPTPAFICFNQNKYYCYTITSSGKLRKPYIDDVRHRLYEFGQWKIKKDTLYLQELSFNKVKIQADTVFIGINVFLIDKTDKFLIENCNCDSLVAQFKGGHIDSIETILNYIN